MEHKFRAKTLYDLDTVGNDKPLKKGEWFYFTLQEIWNKKMADYFIDWSTLGMFTGLLDKNGKGKEIYDGDRLQHKDGNKGEVCGGDGFWKIRFQAFSTGLSSGCIEAMGLKVIGTKFDNPDQSEKEE